MTRGGRDANLRGTKLRPRRQDAIARPHIVANLVKVVPRDQRRRNDHLRPLAAETDFLDHDDAVGAVGHHAAGQDASRRARRDGSLERATRGRFSEHTQRPARVGCADRVPIDRARGKGRERPIGDEVLGKDAPDRVRERHPFRGEDGGVLEHERRGLVSVDQGISRCSHPGPPIRI